MNGHEDREDLVAAWIEALEARHLSELTFAEVRRAVQALSSLWVGRRERIASGAAFDGAGKRAAFALYFAPLHFLVVQEVVRALSAAPSPPARILDLGCGTGVAGAAWAIEAGPRASLTGVDRSAWAANEARWNWQRLGVSGTARVGNVVDTRLDADAIVAAFTVNELGEDARARLLAHLLDAAGEGARVLIVEPLARSAVPWWPGWVAAFQARGGRADEWRLRMSLPELIVRFDRASGLDHRETGVRSLYTVGRSPAGRRSNPRR